MKFSMIMNFSVVLFNYKLFWEEKTSPNTCFFFFFFLEKIWLFGQWKSENCECNLL